MNESPLAEIRIGHITSQWAENNHLFVSYKPQSDSTNKIAKDEAFEESLLEEPLCLYLTDHQTSGRGRGQNTWINDTPGGSLLSSWSYLLKSKPQPTTSCLVGLALYRACSTTWPFLPWSLKAPNDIYIADKKVAGILLESIIQGDNVRLIAGIGLNITSSPQTLASATSLLSSLPEGASLLGPDYMAFLDRLLFELTDAVSHCDEPLSTTDQLSLLMALNKFPLLAEKYTGMNHQGSLFIGDKEIPWTQL